MDANKSKPPGTPLIIIILFMVLAGVCNTLLTKYQNMQCVRDCDTSKPKTFEQPVLQTAQMFIGQMGCWLIGPASRLINYFRSYRYKAVSQEDSEDDSRVEIAGENALSEEDLLESEKIPMVGWSHLQIAIPAMCDLTGTTFMNIGFLFVVASIYQMTRGSVILFSAIFSVIFLKARIRPSQWAWLFVAVFGIGVVGLASVLNSEEPLVPPETPEELVASVAPFDVIRLLTREVHTESSAATNVIVGIFFIVTAQIFTASQFVREEFMMAKYAITSSRVVSWEGTFGFLGTALLMITAHLFYGSTPAGQYGYFDLTEGLSQMFGNRAVLTSSLLVMFSIAVLNHCGITVVSRASSTHRALIDTCRTVVIWGISLHLGWESFSWLQVLGFSMFVIGGLAYRREPSSDKSGLSLPAEDNREDPERAALATGREAS